MTSPYAGKTFTKDDAQRLGEAFNETQALKGFITDRFVKYETMVGQGESVKRHCGYKVDPFYTEKRENNSGVETEVFKVEVSLGGDRFGETWESHYVPVNFVFSDGDFEKRYAEAKALLDSFAPLSATRQNSYR